MFGLLVQRERDYDSVGIPSISYRLCVFVLKEQGTTFSAPSKCSTTDDTPYDDAHGLIETAANRNF